MPELQGNLAHHPAHKMIEIGGTWINQKFQRTSVNSETKYALLKYCFEVLYISCKSSYLMLKYYIFKYCF